MVQKNFLPLKVRVTAARFRMASKRHLPITVAFADDDDDDDDDEDDKKKKKKIRIKDDKGGDETKRLIEKARRQEREKAQTQIDEANKKARIATKRLLKLEGAMEALKEAKTKDGIVDVEKLLTRAHKKWTALQEASGGGETDELRSELEKLRKKVQKSETLELRRRLIAEAGGDDSMIVELVKGDTEDEIEESIEAAQAAFKKYGAKSKKKGRADDDDDEDDDESDEDEDDDADDDEDEDEDDDDTASAKRKKSRTPPEARTPAERGGSRRRKGDKTLDGVKSMSSQEYAAKRPQIMDRLRQRYQGGGSPFTGRRSGARG